MPTEVLSGAWRTAPWMSDYRIEQLSDMLVERATWSHDASTTTKLETIIAAPGFIWFRFWILDKEQVVEKYFGDDGQSIGMSVPVVTNFARNGGRVSTLNLDLELWIGLDGQVTVLGEEPFDAAVGSGALSAEQASDGERLIRELTLDTAQGRFPPALIRNFELNLR